jgi:hypothetical protein
MAVSADSTAVVSTELAALAEAVFTAPDLAAVFASRISAI